MIARSVSTAAIAMKALRNVALLICQSSSSPEADADRQRSPISRVSDFATRKRDTVMPKFCRTQAMNANFATMPPILWRCFATRAP